MKRGIILGVIQVGLVLATVGRYMYDRATLPREWRRAMPYDPYLPIRGRYIQIRIEDDSRPLAFFIPENIPDPSVRQPGEELWVEVTLPKEGPPRPIRLAVKTDDGRFTPLDIN
jgi:hypothetical protein